MIWETVLLALHVIVAATLIGFVLLQHGKGADMGAAFGSGSSGSLFGAAGSANFLSRTTAMLATVFFLSSLGLTYLAANRGAPKDLMQPGVTQKAPEAASKSAEIPAPAPPPGKRARSGGAPKRTRLEIGRRTEVIDAVTDRRRGEIGRHAVLRGQWRKPWEFESPRRHQAIQRTRRLRVPTAVAAGRRMAKGMHPSPGND